MSLINKIKNPNAGKPQIFLALLYIAVLGGLTAYFLCDYLALSKAVDIGASAF